MSEQSPQPRHVETDKVSDEAFQAAQNPDNLTLLATTETGHTIYEVLGHPEVVAVRGIFEAAVNPPRDISPDDDGMRTVVIQTALLRESSDELASQQEPTTPSTPQ